MILLKGHVDIQNNLHWSAGNPMLLHKTLNLRYGVLSVRHAQSKLSPITKINLDRYNGKILALFLKKIWVHSERDCNTSIQQIIRCTALRNTLRTESLFALRRLLVHSN